MFAKINKTMARRFVWVMVAALVGILLFSVLPALAQTSVSVSGLEIFPGVPCKVGEATTCGVVFVGTVDGKPKDAVGFTIRYSGKAGSTEGVIIRGGFWKLVYQGQKYQGEVTSGNVNWSGSCGTDGTVGTISAQLSGGASFNGCLNDFRFKDGKLVPKYPAPIKGTITLP